LKRERTVNNEIMERTRETENCVRKRRRCSARVRNEWWRNEATLNKRN
jgi:hypothetical protein